MKLSGAEGQVLGVVHGVQPAYGAPAAYMRIKAGFEGSGITGRLASRFLGPTGRDVTALLANAIGGLELLPGKHYVTSQGSSRWLEIPDLPAARISSRCATTRSTTSTACRPSCAKAPGPARRTTPTGDWSIPELLTPEGVSTKTDNPLDDGADAMEAVVDALDGLPRQPGRRPKSLQDDAGHLPASEDLVVQRRRSGHRRHRQLCDQLELGAIGQLSDARIPRLPA